MYGPHDTIELLPVFRVEMQWNGKPRLPTHSPHLVVKPHYELIVSEGLALAMKHKSHYQESSIVTIAPSGDGEPIDVTIKVDYRAGNNLSVHEDMHVDKWHIQRTYWRPDPLWRPS
jgi:hypothetical protein